MRLFLALHLEGDESKSWAQSSKTLDSICHYAFLAERRSVCLWATFENDEDFEALDGNGWKRVNLPDEKMQPKIAFISQKEFWTKIQSL